MNTWTDVLPDDCSCRWINYSDNGGWVLRWRNPDCPRHGYTE